jgi:plasmid stabilization system protein ParE
MPNTQFFKVFYGCSPCNTGASSYVFYSKQHQTTRSDRAVLARHWYFATSFVKELHPKHRKAGQLSRHGSGGRVHGTRDLVIHENYLAIYRVRADGVEILRIHPVTRRL